MSIQASVPTVVLPQEEAVFDKWWISRLEISASAPPDANLRVEFKKFRTMPQGNVEFSMDPPVTLHLLDLLTVAEGDGDLAAILNAVYAKLQTIGVAQGVL